MKQEIIRLANVVEHLRNELNKDLPSQHIALLLAVARTPGVTMPELCDLLDMPQGTLSRNVKLLSHYYDTRKGDAKLSGYGLLRSDQASHNKYQRSVFLTDEGRKLVSDLVVLMGDGVLSPDVKKEDLGESGLRRSRASF